MPRVIIIGLCFESLLTAGFGSSSASIVFYREGSALGRNQALDGLRAVAVAAVILVHAFRGKAFTGGFVGVDIFFVLSGYLITALFLAEKNATGRISLIKFYLRSHSADGGLPHGAAYSAGEMCRVATLLESLRGSRRAGIVHALMCG
ncbi:MAG: acyltransferase family protein [Xanthobacteraceae bacterium]